MIKIGYAGTLSGYDPDENKSYKHSWFEKLYKTYRNNFELSLTRSGYYLFKALEVLKKEYAVTNQDIQIHLWGNIDPLNQKQIEAFNIENLVKIEGYKSKETTHQLLKESDILFLPMELNGKEHNTLFIPGKVYEYMALCKPILMLSEQSDCHDLVRKSGLGIFSNPTDFKQVAMKLKEIIDNPSILKTMNADHDFIASCSAKEKCKDIVKVFDLAIKKYNN